MSVYRCWILPGGDAGAREARLSIMIGGDDVAVGCAMPLFNVMGKNNRHMGAAGKGQYTKMVNQILIASNMIGVVEGLLFARKYVFLCLEWVVCSSSLYRHFWHCCWECLSFVAVVACLRMVWL